MKDMGIVRGMEKQAQTCIVGKTTVYVHTNITPVEETDMDGNPIEGLYEYHEIQYGKDEYIELLRSNLESTQEAVDFLLMK